MTRPALDIQGDWKVGHLREAWPLTADNRFMFGRIGRAPVQATAAGARGPILEVAAAEAGHAARLSNLGYATYALEPSPTMLVAARERIAEWAGRVPLIRGIAEALPFPDATFDRVLCDSALDHLADPENGIREMARVTRPDGRVVLTFVNYGGASARLSRLVYRLGRRTGRLPPETDSAKLFWDSPVPFEHTFECTLADVEAMCAPYLERDVVYGVSLGWNVPGWGPLLERIPFAQRLLRLLDRAASALPSSADFVVSTWRPRARAEWPVDDYRVRRTNPIYRRLIRDEAAYWAKARVGAFFGPVADATAPARNAAFTGDPSRSWLDDLAARGPFRAVAALGSDDLPDDVAWLRAGGSERLDVYELSPAVIEQARARLGPLAARVRFVETDLNFVELPPAAYDLVWTSGCLHAVTNLEHLYAQVARVLRPGGLFALHGYVGERRLQYAPARLARVNALLATVPARFRLTEELTAPDPILQLSPFQAVRAPDILPLARARFDVVHCATGGRLFPLFLGIDVAAIARDDPALLDRLLAAEAAAANDPTMTPCAAYAVFRRRAEG